MKDIIQKALNETAIKALVESDEYWYTKAQLAYNDFKNSKQLTNDDYRDMRIMLDKEEFSYTGLLESIKNNIDQFELFKRIGTLIAYLDSKAANKNELNDYADKRVLASAGIRQNVWMKHLLIIHQKNDYTESPESIQYLLKHLEVPQENLPIASTDHRKMINHFLFDTSEGPDMTESLAHNFFDTYGIQVKNQDNLMVLYTRLIYSEEIRAIWNRHINIWKVSHGLGIKEFTAENREKFMNENIVLVHKDTGKSQSEKFVKEMRVGDYIYLTHSSSIVLLGQIISDAKLNPDFPDYYYRKYKVIAMCKDHSNYTGIKKGWSPNYNSTVGAVPHNAFIEFEKTILEPYFELTLKDLNSESSFVDIDTVDIEVEVEAIEEESDRIKNLNVILYGPPGTGKTYHTVLYAMAYIGGESLDAVCSKDYKAVKSSFDSYKQSGNISFVTFHQNFTYEDFVEGIKPKVVNQQVIYEIQKGIFFDLCERAKGQPLQKFVLVIDEINRGNIASIFGELITLIEPSKRSGKMEALSTILPYSKLSFSVPKNLMIIGTMNTADRSISMMDTALRRRFSFEEMMPNTDVLVDDASQPLIAEGVNIPELMTVINQRIAYLYDREHTIGHAYFMPLCENAKLSTLSEIMMKKIIPLLQEYFFEDYEKIRIVLADHLKKNRDDQFIIKEKVTKDVALQAIGSRDEYVFRINQNAFGRASSYTGIYQVSENEQE